MGSPEAVNTPGVNRARDNVSMSTMTPNKMLNPIVRKTGEAGLLEDKVTTNFLKLMDVIED